MKFNPSQTEGFSDIYEGEWKDPSTPGKVVRASTITMMLKEAFNRVSSPKQRQAIWPAIDGDLAFESRDTGLAQTFGISTEYFAFLWRVL
jgi:hypothetical protein